MIPLIQSTTGGSVNSFTFLLISFIQIFSWNLCLNSYVHNLMVLCRRACDNGDLAEGQGAANYDQGPCQKQWKVISWKRI